jgi:2-enoate reductase
MKLFESGRIGKLNIKNRIVMAPMGVGGMAQSDGTLSQRGINYYAARAKGGAGLIITGLCRVDRTIEALPITPFVPELTLDNKIYVSWLDELANAVHDYGAKIALQLSAGEGRILTRQYGIKAPAAPSSLPWLRDPAVMTRELTVNEIEHLIQAFEFAAEVIGISGIDAIELHCHGDLGMAVATSARMVRSARGRYILSTSRTSAQPTPLIPRRRLPSWCPSMRRR